MIVGCYSMDLYCEAANAEYRSTHPEEMQQRCTDWPAQFTGRSEAQCVQKARAAGWTIRLKLGKCYCPNHPP